MIANIRVSDETFDKYVGYDKSNPRLAMEQQLERYRDVSPKDRVLVLNAEQRKRLEKLWSAPIEDMDQFVSWIEKLHSMHIMGQPIPLTKNQINQLAQQAGFYHKAPAEYIGEKILQLLRQGVGV